MPVVQLAAHAKSSTLYGRSYSRSVVQSFGRTSQFFLLDGSLLFFIIMGLRSASSAIMFHMMYINEREMQNNALFCS